MKKYFVIILLFFCAMYVNSEVFNTVSIGISFQAENYSDFSPQSKTARGFRYAFKHEKYSNNSKFGYFLSAGIDSLGIVDGQGLYSHYSKQFGTEIFAGREISLAQNLAAGPLIKFPINEVFSLYGSIGPTLSYSAGFSINYELDPFGLLNGLNAGLVGDFGGRLVTSKGICLSFGVFASSNLLRFENMVLSEGDYSDIIRMDYVSLILGPYFGVTFYK